MASVINLSVKFDANIFISDRYIAILLLRQFGCEMPIPAHFGGLTLNVIGYCGDPQKAHLWLETRVLAYRSCRSVKKCDLGPRWRKQKKERKKEKTRKETQRCDKSHICPDHPRCATATKVAMWGGVPDIVNHAKFNQNRFRGFGSQEVEICHFPMTYITGYGYRPTCNTLLERNRTTFGGFMSKNISKQYEAWRGFSATTKFCTSNQDVNVTACNALLLADYSCRHNTLYMTQSSPLSPSPILISPSPSHHGSDKNMDSSPSREHCRTVLHHWQYVEILVKMTNYSYSSRALKTNERMLCLSGLERQV